ncbi:replication-associated recombination protein A [Natranaerobius trueperi]|uniref:Replication-associated recombination protein A n=1 Tax=Natranaerobius trueperi TaxID=759412 RepID=A0A226BZ08_9FIRM|nr:replication-associated recombination protein A [Natranaerobius trueperi]OWZ83439.1 AAA family ATPase [Natranaerobius trueperi]
MDLFSYNLEEKTAHEAPLADRIRPLTLEEFVGQNKVLGEGKLLRRAIKADRLSSIILYGPPGIGKTTIAKIIASNTQKEFHQLNAVISGVKDLRDLIEKAQEIRSQYNRGSVLFIDEIHRFNKNQQDALLPYVEDGTVILIGATTENPYFSVNNALLSRSQVFKLEELTRSEMEKLLNRALEDKEKGLGNYQVEIDDKAISHFIDSANGDIRVALNALELAVMTTLPNENGVRTINLEVAEDSIQEKAVYYDKDGDNHYDVISAFIKSLRGSDPDAGLYWLARMLYAGEDPLFVCRRLLIFASEDVGNADPQALQVALSVYQAVERLGLPEGKITLAQGVTYLASAPKSNSSYIGVLKAQKEVESGIGTKSQVPNHLKDAHYQGAKELGHGRDYKYPHHYPENFISQTYLPEEIKDKVFYEPTLNGKEAQIKERLQRLFLKRGDFDG